MTRPESARSSASPIADDFREAGRPAPRTEDAESDARFGERRVGRGDPQVTCEREFDAAAARRAVDSGDDDAFCTLDVVRYPLAVGGERVRRLLVRPGHHVEVRTGTERRARATEKDDGLFGLPNRLGEGVQSVEGERVSSLRAVDGHDPNFRVVSDANHGNRLESLSKGLWRFRRKFRQWKRPPGRAELRARLSEISRQRTSATTSTDC